jgi:hypothetical protein
MKKMLWPLGLLGLVSACVPASAALLTFDDLSGYGVAVPSSYNGFSFMNWQVDSTCSGAGFTGTTCNIYPYTPASFPTSIYTTTTDNSISSTTPFVFDGAWFTGHSDDTVTFKLYLGATLVSGPPLGATLPPFAASATPMFVPSLYTGAVDRVVLVEAHPGNTVMDNFTYNGGVSAVPVPAAAWLLVSGLGVFGLFARKRRA